MTLSGRITGAWVAVLSVMSGCNWLEPTNFACNETTACPTGYCCGSNGSCAAEGSPICELPFDAGIDAGTPDAGIDAGIRDAGLDAGSTEPPAGLSYATNPATYTRGVAITPDTPSIAGGPVSGWMINPALPSGLTFSTGTGVISGTPAAPASTGFYVVTASNSAGSTTTTLTLTVVDVPPSNLSYSANPAVFTKGVAIPADTPTSSGGTVTSWEIAPSPPVGLSFSAATGVLTGTPSLILGRTSFTVSAFNSGGSTSVTLSLTVNDVPPADLTYATNPAVYTLGTAIASDAPSSSGGAVTAYSVTPALPAGLLLDPVSGILTGTPTAVAAGATYTVTAANSGGSTQTALILTVNDVPPRALAYVTNPLNCTRGQRITDDVPSNQGGVVISYGISPTLPQGLSLDPATGIVGGTPGFLSPQSIYTVTATNSGGSTTALLTVTVNDVSPGRVSYAQSPLVLTKGQQIADDEPSNTGGAVVSWSVTPALPSGIVLSATTGVISGTPTMLSPAANYTVTATNTGGFTQAVLRITVNDVPPSGLSYPVNPLTCVTESAITPDLPTVSGGPVTAWSVNPSLPAGLTLDGTTGAVSGTPTAGAPQMTYTITASNSGGSTTAGLVLTVDAIAPANLTYATNPAVYVQGAPIAGNAPSSTGGTVFSYSINPALPPGLSFDTGSGLVSGTPLVVTPQTSYTVTAMNNGGSTQVTLLLTVQPESGIGTMGMNAPIATGSDHVCALANGGVLCWGRNDSGQLGDGSTSSSLIPAQVAGITSGAQGVAASGGTSCAIVNGAAWCWGGNASGQLGNNSTANALTPVPVSGLTSGVEALSCANVNTCAIVNGGAWCWGENTSGRLGNDSTVGSLVPVRVTGITSGTSAISAGYTHVCAVVNGGAWCWGEGVDGELGDNTRLSSSVPVQVSGLSSGVQAIGAGEYETCALVNGGVKCWGDASIYGDLGNNSTQSNVPVAVPGLTSNVQAIAVGQLFACALQNGGVQCWGYGGLGELGNNTTVMSSSTPVPVSSLSSGVQAIVAQEESPQACALVNGAVECWGDNVVGELGNNSTVTSPVPVPVANLTSGLEAVVAGDDHTCVLLNGGVQCWGLNMWGQLGNGNTIDQSVPTHVVGLTSGVQSLSAGGDHTCAVVNGGVRCWGNNASGQLGNGSTARESTPVAVTGLSNGVQAIAAGAYHTCAIVNGGVQCWGSNSSGQLGVNSQSQVGVPVLAAGMTSGVQAIAAGNDVTCAVSNGGLQCWGGNFLGELGNNSTATSSSAPVQVLPAATGVVSVAMGQSGGCAQINGTVQCWGYGADGELGDGAYGSSPVPVPVSGIAGTARSLSLAPNGLHTCAIADGAMECWGFDSHGELGQGGLTDADTPEPPMGFTSGVQLIAAGGSHSCALMDNVVSCWGANANGQLGNNSTVESHLPVPVHAWAP
jgi:alpha-tubulin suppressor-like RCC1 family protein